MPRPRNDAEVDLSVAHDLTAGLIERARCPEGKRQAFLRDAKGNGLRVRVTNLGTKVFVFEAKLGEQTIRRTLGNVRTLSIEEARALARQEQAVLDRGEDPRELAKEKVAAKEAAAEHRRSEVVRLSVTGLEAWAEYVEEGKKDGFTNRGPWSERHHQDHLEFVDAGGKTFKRGKGRTAPGLLHELLSLPLVRIDQEAIEIWLRKGNQTRPSRTALGFRLLRGFLNWCHEHPQYKSIAQREAHTPKSVRKLVRRQKPPRGVLQREQLAAWFAAVGELEDPVRSIYLQCLLLTGARKSEVAELKWDDAQFNFGGTLHVKDKYEGDRDIPCTPYVAELLQRLPRTCEWVFGEGALTLAHNAAYNHRKALKAAGLPHLTLQALRKSYGTLAEWVACPPGVVAQLQGHKPSATAERHYRERPLDLLRVWSNKVEAWMLEQAKVSAESGQHAA